ncbi:MAG: Dienelactone hydrolase [Acidimicrobiales bacterium]|nr:Dienelactone hydrolase [Acidimicrobiales bacterium]
MVVPGSGRGPGVLVLHSWWGLTQFFRNICDRLADEGFVALAPDLHGDDRTADRPDEAEALLASTDPDRTAKLVAASIVTLRGMPATPDGPIGVIGFSMGASWALWAASRFPDDVAAVVAYYGTQDVDFAAAQAAFQGHFAEHDEFVSDDQLVEMEAHLRLLDKDVDFHRYPGTGHWFVEEDQAAAYVQSAADLAWERTVAFLHQHLDPLLSGAAPHEDHQAGPDVLVVEPPAEPGSEPPAPSV